MKKNAMILGVFMALVSILIARASIRASISDYQRMEDGI